MSGGLGTGAVRDEGAGESSCLEEINKPEERISRIKALCVDAATKTDALRIRQSRELLFRL